MSPSLFWQDISQDNAQVSEPVLRGYYSRQCVGLRACSKRIFLKAMQRGVSLFWEDISQDNAQVSEDFWKDISQYNAQVSEPVLRRYFSRQCTVLRACSERIFLKTMHRSPSLFWEEITQDNAEVAEPVLRGYFSKQCTGLRACSERILFQTMHRSPSLF